MGKMYLMCGLSGVGKTTFAQQFAADHNIEYLGIDDFYPKVEGAYDDPNIVFDTWIRFWQAIHTRMMEGKTVIIDTNAPTRVKRRQFVDWFPKFDEYNLIYIFGDFFLRQTNNMKRSRYVPVEEMARMEEEFEAPVNIVNIASGIAADNLEWADWDNIYTFHNVDNKLTELYNV